jgi:hypothetical protein
MNEAPKKRFSEEQIIGLIKEPEAGEGKVTSVKRQVLFDLRYTDRPFCGRANASNCKETKNRVYHSLHFKAGG